MIYISGLKIETLIGIYEWEQHNKQIVVLDIELDQDVSTAAGADDVSTTYNYASVAERVTSYIEASHFQLIETLAEQTAQLILQEFGVPKLRIRVSKPGAVSNAEDVGVSIERSQPDA